jgi:hypothetical protein
MKDSWRIGPIVGLVILGSWTAADAQTRPVGATGRRSAQAGASSGNQPIIAPPSAEATAAAMSRRRPDPSFNRVATTSRAPMSRATRAGARSGGPAALSTPGEDDPFRPYSARVREADRLAAMGSTRPQPRSARPPQPVASSYNYYPGMRTSQHPNANVPTVRPHCVPTRGGVMAGGMGRRR